MLAYMNMPTTSQDLNGYGLHSLESLQRSIEILEKEELSPSIRRREQRDNHSLSENYDNNYSSASEGQFEANKQTCIGGLYGANNRNSIHRRRRSSASRKPSSPALLPNMNSSLLDAKNLIEPTVSSRIGTCSMPHPDKIDKGGEDASIVCTGPDGSTLTAVLDGVGGWAAVGVDSGIYSRALVDRIGVEFHLWHERQAQMKNLKVQSRRVTQDRQKPLLTILERAYDHVDDLGIPGTCTACLSLLFPSGKLHVLNLGDSGLRVIRDSKVVFATVEQQVSFNYPRQLGTSSMDIPADGDYHILDVLAGDIILSGSDGVFDNVWEHEYLPLLKGVPLEYSAVLERTARRIAETAHRHGMDPYYLSPFASNAMQVGMTNCLGGKLDDTTVVVQKVLEGTPVYSA